MSNWREKFKNIPFFGTLIRDIYRKLFPNHNLMWCIEKYMPKNSATVIQVGSNDGKTGDPIFDMIQKYKSWNVIFIEPVPYYFERLKANYGNESRFTFENVAINDGQEQTFYSVRPDAIDHHPDLPFWHNQLSSFDRTNITKHFDGKLEPFIEEIQLKGITLTNLLEKNEINTISLIHIDCEGYDWKILSQLNLEKYKPIMVLYEHVNLTKSEKKESIEFLLNEYHIIQFNEDYLCVRKDVITKNEANNSAGICITSSKI